MINTIKLLGCRPEPLLSYLKALGVFRLVAEQADKTARAAWENDVLVLHTALSKDELTAFFTERYAPTPIVAPWAGGSGFFGGDNVTAVEAICKNASIRLVPYQQIIVQVKAILVAQHQTEKPQGEAKDALLRMYRRELPDEFLNWMDCAVVLQNEGQSFPPILGTGGNDGRLDFTQNFMQRLVDIGFTNPLFSTKSIDWLDSALFGVPAQGLQKNAIGQYDPGRAGGPNATQGLDGDSRVNPWEYVLMLEGALLMAGTLTRRLDVNSTDKASFPFTVNVSVAGNGSLDEREDARGEIWFPLWRNPMRLNELRHVMSEGRAQVGKRQARNTVDFARAIAELGVDRGLTGFTRYGFLKRSGKSFLATPLGRFETQSVVAHAYLLSEIDAWLDRYRLACRGDNVQPRFGSALRQLDNAIFAYCRFGDSARFGAIVHALGACEQALAFNADKPGVVGKSKFTTSPVPLLSKDWLAAAQEDSAEFRIALALASIRQTDAIGALRTNLEPVTRSPWGWRWAEPQDRAGCVWAGHDLIRNLQAALDRRMMEATRSGTRYLPLESNLPASIGDVSQFLAGQTDDARIEAWLWGLMLIDLSHANFADLQAISQPFSMPPVPRVYALLRLLFLPAYHALQAEDGNPIKPEPAILNHLRASRLDEACQVAMRRLRASGFISLPGPTSGGGLRSAQFSMPAPAQARLAAALLIPLSKPDQLQKWVLRANVEVPNA